MQIIVKGTTACNFHCVYCSEGDKEPVWLDEALFYKVVDELPAVMDANHDRMIRFLWHGGEPLMIGRPRLARFMDYAITHLADRYDVHFSMQSNGYLIDEEWIRFLKKYDVSMGISLDGYPELHDANRPTRDGGPTAAVVLKNIAAMREAGIMAGTLMVLNTAEPVDDEKLFNFIYKNHLSPKIHSVIPCGRASARMDTQKIYDNYVDLLIALYKRSIMADEPVIIDPLNEIMNAILGVTPLRECSFNGSCGREFICLYPDGEMGFCGRDNASRTFTYGNIREKSLLELYQSDHAEKIRERQPYLQTHDCQNCKDWNLCHGGCSFEAVNAFGALSSRYPYCESRRRLLHYLRTEGLLLMKKRLVDEKRKYRIILQEKQKLLEEVKQYAGE